MLHNCPVVLITFKAICNYNALFSCFVKLVELDKWG